MMRSHDAFTGGSNASLKVERGDFESYFKRPIAELQAKPILSR